MLAQQYGVSRSVVREALRSCASLGLTETRTGKGTFVVADRVGGDLALGQYSARDSPRPGPISKFPPPAWPRSGAARMSCSFSATSWLPWP